MIQSLKLYKQRRSSVHTWLTKSRVWASALKTVLANSLKEGLREKAWLVQRVLREARINPWLLSSMGATASTISMDLALRSFKSFAPRNCINCSKARPHEPKASKFNALPIEIGDHDILIGPLVDLIDLFNKYVVLGLKNFDPLHIQLMLTYII